MIESAPPPGPWATDPARHCAGVDPRTFFPSTGENARVADAKAICRGCPVIDACRDYAVATFATGVWGGTSEIERKRLRRQLGGASAARAQAGLTLTMRDPARCGTPSGYNRHRRLDQPACPACTEAHNAATAARKAAARQAVAS